MTEMEMDYAGKIMAWAMMNDDVPLMNEDTSLVTTEQITQMYWDMYFNSCTMNDKYTGMEQPHDQNTWTDIFGNDDFYTLYGVN